MLSTQFNPTGEPMDLLAAIKPSPPETADDHAREYEETKRRVIEGRASVQEAQDFINFLEGAIPAP